MKINGLLMVMIAVAALSFAVGRVSLHTAGGVVTAAQPRQDVAPTESSPEARAMIEAATPGEHHVLLEQLIGEWSGQITIRMDPEGEPFTAGVSIKREWVLSKRFVREIVEADAGADRFEGLGYLGFDNIDRQYQAVWMDDSSTGIQFETGTYHPDDKVMHFRGGYRDPLTGRLVNTWSKLNLSDPDRHSMIAYSTDADGKTFKAMEGVLERKHAPEPALHIR